MKELKTELIRLISLAYEEEQILIGRLSDGERAETGSFKHWSAKDLIAHNSFWKLNKANNITGTLSGESPPIVGHEINKEVFEKNRTRSWDDIIKYAGEAHKTLVSSITAAAHKDLTSQKTLPWQDGIAIWKIIIFSSYLHPIGHLAKYYVNRSEAFYAINLWNDASGLMEQLPATPGMIGTAKYNLARFYALSGQEFEAVRTLKKALKLNPKLIEQSKEEPDLSSVREQPECRALYSGQYNKT